MLKFVRAAFKDLTTMCLGKIVLQVFYQCVFSYKIFNYKVTHGGVLIRYDDYVKFVEPDRAPDQKAAFQLPKLFIKPASLA